jgi:hypothetical protein
MRAPGHCAWRLAPRLGVAVGAWGASAHPAHPAHPARRGPLALMSRSSWASAVRAARGFRGGFSSERQAARSKLTERPLSKFAAAAQLLADVKRSAGRPSGPIRRCRSRRPSTIWWPARREHAGAGSVALLPLLHGCPPVVARLNAADAAWAVTGWVGQRLHNSKCSPSLKFVRTARPFESCAKKSSTHQNLVRNVRYESGFGGLRPPVRNAENSNSTYRHGRKDWQQPASPPLKFAPPIIARIIARMAASAAGALWEATDSPPAS